MRRFRSNLKRRSSRRQAPTGMMTLSVVLLFLNIVFAVWYQDETLPMLAKYGPCRVPIFFFLPLSIIVWLMCLAEVFSWIRSCFR
jgi:hypothetical protein